MSISKDPEQSNYDVAIVGGGLTGAALALSLADLQLKVVLLDQQNLEQLCETNTPVRDTADSSFSPEDFGARVSALTPASINLLEELGAWQNVKLDSFLPYQAMHVWDELGTASINFQAKDLNRESLGAMVENRNVVRALYTELTNQSNVDMKLGDGVSKAIVSSSDSSTNAQIELASGESISSKLLVVADGAGSRVRTMLGYEMREWDYNHHAIVTTVQTSNSHENTAWQRFSEGGPLAFLPLQDPGRSQRFSSIVWSLKTSVAEQYMEMDDAAFSQVLGRGIEERLGEIEAVSKRFCFPLRQRHAKQYTKANTVLIGDAAHSIHPLAGQGVNLGFKDVEALSAVIQQALKDKVFIADASVLKRYQRQRQGDNLLMMGVMEGFKRFFENENPVLRLVRNVGMKLVDDAAPVKKQIIRQAMGL